MLTRGSDVCLFVVLAGEVRTESFQRRATAFLFSHAPDRMAPRHLAYRGRTPCFFIRTPYLAALRDGALRCYWKNAGATLGVLLLDTSGAGTASVDSDSEEKNTRKTTMLPSAHSGLIVK